MAPEERLAHDGDRATRIEIAVEEYRRRVAAGEAKSVEALADALSNLLPELGGEIRKRLKSPAHKLARGDAEDAARTHTFRESESGSGQLEVRCPNCHAPTDVAVDTALTDLTCSACGSHFSLVDQDQVTRLAPSLSKLGRFELIERLGVGGFGSVWKARDKELDRTVAIKVPRQAGMTAEEQEKFFREARAAAQLRHPGIVSVHEVGRDGESVFIVSDFVRGVTLGDWLTGQQITGREAAELCAKIADALDHAHEQGVVHRDLKPANIMIDGDCQPHLMDFGLARREAGEVTVTMDGQVIGTPAYMSPEQAGGEGHSADRRSDVYSLGVILFQLLTGELPFRGNARMLVHQVIHELPPSPRKFNGSVPKDLETITLKCLEKEPSRRYSTAGELAAELRRYLAGEPIQARPLGRAQRAWRWAKRRPAAAALLAVLAAVAVIGPIVAVQQTLLRVQRDRLSAEREQALRQLDEKNEELQNQLADNLFERASVEYDAGKVSEAIAILAAAHESATPSNPLRAAFRNLMAGWSTGLAQRFVHNGGVAAVAISPDGQIFATGSDDRTARLWDRESGAPRSAPMLHQGAVQSVAFSPDGRLLLTGGGDATARFWEVVSGKQVGEPFSHGAHVFAVAFSPDGKSIVTAGDDRVGRIWEVATRKQIGESLRHDESIRSVAFSPDGDRVATGSSDKTARLWDAHTGQPVGEVMRNRDQIRAVAFSPDGRNLLTGGYTDPLKIWDAETGTLSTTLPGFGWTYSVAFSHAGRMAWAGNIVGEVAAFDVATKRKVLEFKQEGRILALAVSPDNSEILSGSADATARLITLNTNAAIEVSKQDSRVKLIAVSPDSKRVVTAGDPKVARLWDLQSGNLLSEMKHGDAVVALAFSPAGDRVLTASRDKKICWWDGITGKSLGDAMQCEGTISAMVFTSEGEPILAASTPNGLQLLDGRNGQRLASFDEKGRIMSAAFSANGQVFAGEVRDQGVVMWDVETGAVIGRPLRIGDVYSLALSPDGTTLVTGGDDETANLWDVRSGKPIGGLKQAGPVVYAVTYSPDGSRILTGCENNRARLWDARTGKPMGGPVRFGQWVVAVAFSPDGRTLLSGCQDGRLWRWDAPPPPLTDDAARVAAWARARSAMVLDDQRAPRQLSQSEWFAAKELISGGEAAQPLADAKSDESNKAPVLEQPSYLQPPATALRDKLGQNVKVELDVARVDRRGGGVVLLRSLRDISRLDCFDVMLMEQQLSLLNQFGIKYPDELLGRRIRVIGKLEMYGNHIEVKVSNVLAQLQFRGADGEWLPADVATEVSEGFISPPLSRLRELVGTQQTIEFRVLGSGGRTRLYLNSKSNFSDPDCFTVVVVPDQISAFTSLGIKAPVTELLGKTVQVTGTVEKNADRSTQIKVEVTNLPAQLKIVDTPESQTPNDGP